VYISQIRVIRVLLYLLPLPEIYRHGLRFFLFLAVASLVTGVIWGGYLLVLKARGEIFDEENEPILVEYARSFFPVVLIVLVLRSFIAEPFRIPSASMMPTLLIGDFILVNKFTYGIRLPVINKKVIELNEPKRGDIVVFRYPKDPAVDYIKRVIGLPGDRISYYDKNCTSTAHLLIRFP
jgi:signal peptidase I, bacterial type